MNMNKITMLLGIGILLIAIGIIASVFGFTPKGASCQQSCISPNPIIGVIGVIVMVQGINLTLISKHFKERYKIYTKAVEITYAGIKNENTETIF
jgi:uncharacterized membrane protein